MVAAWFTALLGAGLVATALTASTLVRPRSCCRWLLVAYVVFVAETTAITTLLSAFAAVSRTGLGLAVGLTAVAVVTAWLRSGRPRPPAPELPRPHRADAALLVLALAVALSLAYEAVLVVAMPPNNWDSLTYHLARVAAWAQHGGVYWIPDAPTARMNEFQPLAEQQILVWFVATGRAALFALPQLLAQLAIVGAVFEVARKLGYAARASAFAALLFAAFPLVALEATTAQNDLVAAALPVLAVALILEGGFAEVAVAGVATGLALGVKLTTLYALPVVLLLALNRDRRTLRIVSTSAAAAFALLGGWGFVANLVHTGHLLGHGGGRLAQQASPSLIGSPTTLFRIVYGLLDLSGLSPHVTDVLAAAGVAFGVVVAIVCVRRGAGGRAASAAALLAATPLVAARFIPVFAHGVKLAAQAVHLPVSDPATTGGRFFWGIDFGVSEDLSAYGVIGGPLLLLLSCWWLAQRRRTDARVVLGVALPLFLVLLALTSKYNPWLARFLLVPAALTAPLLAAAASRRTVVTAVVGVVVLQLALVQIRNEQKPLNSGTRPWALTQAEALRLTFRPGFAGVSLALDRLVAPGTCIGAVVGPDDPSFVLFGDRLQRRVRFLPDAGATTAARASRLAVVVVRRASGLPARFARAGWRLRALGAPGTTPWLLATRQPAKEDRMAQSGGCGV